MVFLHTTTPQLRAKDELKLNNYCTYTGRYLIKFSLASKTVSSVKLQ